MKFEQDGEVFIINPDYNDLSELKIKFHEEIDGPFILDAKLLYLAKVKGIHDGGNYTYMLYERNGESMTFNEGGNIDVPYEMTHIKQSKEEFLDILNYYDNENENDFFNQAMKEQQYQSLNQELSQKETTSKKPKI